MYQYSECVVMCLAGGQGGYGGGGQQGETCVCVTFLLIYASSSKAGNYAVESI